jgi:hypothetical protein
MNYCVYCGAPLDIDSKFCTNCGKRIKSCPRCGVVLKEDSVFCAKCGTRLDMQTIPPAIPQKEEVEEFVYDDEEENRKNWLYLLCGCAFIALLALSWYGYSQFYKYTHIDVHELLEDLQLPKEYYHSAKEIINSKDFDKDYFFDNKYELRGWIVYNKKYGHEIRFNNETFNTEKDAIEGYFGVIGHILDCWNTSPAIAVYELDRTGVYWIKEESTFYYTSYKSKGIEYIKVGYDNNGRIKFQSADGKYEATFHQVVL